jgi:hypothetical protein
LPPIDGRIVQVSEGNRPPCLGAQPFRWSHGSRMIRIKRWHADRVAAAWTRNTIARHIIAGFQAFPAGTDELDGHESSGQCSVASG